MANTMDLLGALLRRGLTDSSGQRIEHSLGEQGLGAPGGFLEQQLGVSPAKQSAGVTTAETSAPSGPLDSLGGLGEIAKAFFGDESRSKSLAAGGLGALVGAILGGGKKSTKGALGGGALALLGSIALQALRSAQSNAAVAVEPQEQLTAGLREPQNAQEKKHVEEVADLTVRAMINAAKADGRIDEDEMQKVVGELQEDGIGSAERDYLLAEVRKPMCTEDIIRAATSPQLGAQIYAASLLAIEVDTPAERAYLQNLARGMKLDERLVRQIHTTLGVA
jgi:uncharacterized membrane protein YebE (DUF533 family)